MLFNSFSYAVFLPIVFILYWALPHKFRWVLLLAASYYFYMSWNARYVILILFTTVISYSAALMMEKYKNKTAKKMILAGTAVLCLGVLFFFKYFNFVSASLAKFLSLFTLKLDPVTLQLLLPVGISFYTFQTLSYVIDVYRGNVNAEHHFGYYATFISFFPQLVAGPIERTENLLPQIKKRHVFDCDQAIHGIKLMIWGYYKKLVLADTLSVYVSKVYDAPENFRGFSLVLATLFFTIQIYCDFSGYSDIAVGTAKLMGIDLMTNFKCPYFSQSIKEFWSRWHISLSTWFRDYVYIPLGGNRVNEARHCFNLMVTFLASGLWHGANWTFVIWGGMHGAAQIVENIIRKRIGKHKKKNAVGKYIKIVTVFIFVSFAWIFFVSDSVSDATYIITHLLDGIQNPVSYLHDGFYNIGMGEFLCAQELLLIAVLAVYDYFSLKYDVIVELGKKTRIVQWIVYICLGFLIAFYSEKGIAADFVYFQF